MKSIFIGTCLFFAYSTASLSQVKDDINFDREMYIARKTGLPGFSTNTNSVFSNIEICQFPYSNWTPKEMNPDWITIDTPTDLKHKSVLDFKDFEWNEEVDVSSTLTDPIYSTSFQNKKLSEKINTDQQTINFDFLNITDSNIYDFFEKNLANAPMVRTYWQEIEVVPLHTIMGDTSWLLENDPQFKYDMQNWGHDRSGIQPETKTELDYSYENDLQFKYDLQNWGHDRSGKQPETKTELDYSYENDLQFKYDMQNWGHDRSGIQPETKTELDYSYENDLQFKYDMQNWGHDGNRETRRILCTEISRSVNVSYDHDKTIISITDLDTVSKLNIPTHDDTAPDPAEVLFKEHAYKLGEDKFVEEITGSIPGVGLLGFVLDLVIPPIQFETAPIKYAVQSPYYSPEALEWAIRLAETNRIIFELNYVDDKPIPESLSNQQIIQRKNMGDAFLEKKEVLFGGPPEEADTRMKRFQEDQAERLEADMMYQLEHNENWEEIPLDEVPISTDRMKG